MFLRKLVVAVLPLLMTTLLCLLLPLMDGIPFWTEVFKGLTLGVALALILPLCGATKKREPFSGLLWVPLVTLIVSALFLEETVTTMGIAGILMVIVGMMLGSF